MVEHNTLTDPNLHEPKGASTASSGYVPVANGAGATSWANPEASALKHYATIYTRLSDSVTLSTIGTTGQDLPFSNDGPDNGATSDSANNRITINQDGDYYINFHIGFSTVASGDSGLYTFVIQVDGVDSVVEVQTNKSGTSDNGSVTTAGILSLTSGDQITVEISSDNGGNTDDINIEATALVVHQLRAT